MKSALAAASAGLCLLLLPACGSSANRSSLDAASAGKTVVSCSGGEEVQLVIKKLANGTLRANVTVQSVGDSYPTFHYTVTKAGNTYEGGKFKLVVDKSSFEHGGYASKLTVSDLDVDQTVTCKL